MTLHDILKEFRDEARNNRDLGDKFERLMLAFFKLDPLYQSRFSGAWLWMDWQGRDGRPDTGIDIVAQEREDGGFTAIQCKFYDPDHTLDKADIDSFFTASGKKPFTRRMIVSTSDKWSSHAEEALEDQHTPVTRIRVQDLASSRIDWSGFSMADPEGIRLSDKKQPWPHQQKAIDKVEIGFQGAERGKLIMACGTGKTFTALKIAERLVPKGGSVLFLVPSISLISQTLTEWAAQASVSMHCFVVCSDADASKGKRKSKNETEDIGTVDLAFPATTDAALLAAQVATHGGNRDITVVFSTYHSIARISEAQSLGVPEFDLIICDEAHRTTGVALEGEDESHFVKVHDAAFLKGKKRLYMTATPRIYNEVSKAQAKEGDAEIWSMDDPGLFGEEFHKLGFSEAVGSGLLSDYKVLVLAVDEKYISKAFQRQIADSDNQMKLEDAVKIAGCWNGLSKRMSADTELEHLEADSQPMHRAVAFSRTIKDSERFAASFHEIIADYAAKRKAERFLHCEVEHVSGKDSILKRNNLLDWLKATPEGEGDICRILSNARCLSEGVDVPALDSVIFLNPRNSVVDVVQAVGRVMRKAQGKKYGYIILPIGIPADMAPDEALKDNQKYKVVWQVLQALRAHDDRFNATVNKIELNKQRPGAIEVIGVGGDDPEDGILPKPLHGKQLAIGFPHLEEWKEAIYAKIVMKCGDRRYWENWAKDVAEIAERHKARIKALSEQGDQMHRDAFDAFLKGLQENLNPSVDREEAVEMLSQHMVTRPVFDALFEGYAFTDSNPVSKAMQQMLELLEGQAFEKETESLQRFYDSVRERASGIDNAEGKQRIIVELYDKFFRMAFPKMAERLGIVYTPVPVVDFIIRTVDDALRSEFGASLADEGIQILDPFTGTGTFMVRLIQSGLIGREALHRKYGKEMHANEIVLLAYYIAAINIEEAYHGATGEDYTPFAGIVLTDTFQMNENNAPTLTGIMPENNARVRRQTESPIRVIIGNPPYSVGQNNENDGNKNLKYAALDARIRDTYARESTAQNKNSLYDSYIRAIRWASDRIQGKGIVCFVTNGSFIDNNSMAGLRKCFVGEFSSIYCFNLRGNARTQGEQRRMEKGNVFGEGTRTPISITMCIKQPDHKGPAKLHYHDIGDYLSREEKLAIIARFGSMKHLPWNMLIPNADGDWINQRDPAFEGFLPIGDKDDPKAPSIFQNYSRGLATSRDAWAYNFSKDDLIHHMAGMISFYNSQVEDFIRATEFAENAIAVEDFIDNDPTRISWSRGLKQDLGRLRRREFEANSVYRGMYRPFCKQWVYFNRHFNDMVYQLPKLFPTPDAKNLVIVTSGLGASKGFSAMISDSLPNLHLHDTSQCFPLFRYSQEDGANTLFGENESGLKRADTIGDTTLKAFQKHYNSSTITKEDLFYYVYGILHSAEYKRRFEADLRKMLPRIPHASDFWAFSKAGRELASLHLNYETVEPWPLEEVMTALGLDARADFKVGKMAFGKSGKQEDRGVIVYNAHVTLRGIPKEAYEYIVNGKPALDWIMERYAVTTDKESGIKNDPNEWSSDPRYIIDLVKRMVRVSIETVRIVKGLPELGV